MPVNLVHSLKFVLKIITFFNMSISVGRGGGLATIYTNNLKCHLLASELFSSFEVQIFKMDGCNPLLCILVYRPPNTIRIL